MLLSSAPQSRKHVGYDRHCHCKQKPQRRCNKQPSPFLNKDHSETDYSHPFYTPPSTTPKTVSPSNISAKSLGRKTEDSKISTPASVHPHSGMPQEKKHSDECFFPFFKIVKKTHTRWSQATKEHKMTQTRSNKTLENEAIKKLLEPPKEAPEMQLYDTIYINATLCHNLFI